MKRGGYLKRRKRLRHVSAKRQLLLNQRADLLALAQRTACFARDLVPDVHCEGPLDAHEPLTRARGGSITDRDNIVFVCRAHHGFIHRHPIESEQLGLLVHSWANRRPE